MDMLTFNIEHNRKTPIYQQLYNYIKAEIQSGSIKYNTKLPSKRKLSNHLKISQNTVQAAYEQLIEEGYIISEEKKGFFVAKIDNITKIDIPKEKNTTEYKDNKINIKYDFSYHGVDLEEFPFSTWRKLYKDVINEYDKELLLLGDRQGNFNLRSSIADYLYQSRGVNCTANQIIISSGTEFLLQILIQLFDKGSVFGIENPGYERLYQLFTSNHSTYNAIKIDNKGMMLGQIFKSNANILCITPAHQFPSGEIMPINRRIQILNWANEGGNRYIIEDDYDSEFKYSGKPIPALQGLDSNGKVIYMGAFSKSLSPAIRVSYMVLPDKLIKEFQKNLSFIICPVPTIEQKVLYKFINEGYFERHLNKMRNIYKKKREVLVKSLVDFKSEVEILGADAGLHLILKVKNGMTEKELETSALKESVRVYGISRYYLDESYMDDSPKVLIGYATMTEKNIKEAVKKLYKAWL